MAGILDSMTKLALFGVEAKDRQFFEQYFQGQDIQPTFLPVPIDLDSLDSSTEMLSVFVNAPVTREMMERLPQLKLIATRSTGFNHIDIDAAKERGVTVANVPAYGGATVAEYAVALLLMLTRRMPAVLAESRSAKPNRSLERGTDLHGKTIGIIGTGSIGQGMARIAKGFGMEVLGYDVYPNDQQADAIGFDYVSLDELLRRSDIVSLHIPYTPENHHFFDADRLKSVKAGAIILNTARGELVDSAALVDALRSGQVGAAGLDVIESEYLLNPDARAGLAAHDQSDQEAVLRSASIEALQQMSNVIITNHNAFNTDEALEIINRTTGENIVNFLGHKEVHTI